MSHGSVPAPSWFVQYRSRVLAAWVALGILGSSAVWASSYFVTGSDVFSLLAGAGVVTTGILLVGVLTGRTWAIRKGAGSALLLHLARLGALGWQVFDPQFPHTWAAGLQLVGTGMVVLVLALQAGWLHWVAGLPDEVS